MWELAILSLSQSCLCPLLATYLELAETLKYIPRNGSHPCPERSARLSPVDTWRRPQGFLDCPKRFLQAPPLNLDHTWAAYEIHSLQRAGLDTMSADRS